MLVGYGDERYEWNSIFVGGVDSKIFISCLIVDGCDDKMVGALWCWCLLSVGEISFLQDGSDFDLFCLIEAFDDFECIKV